MSGTSQKGPPGGDPSSAEALRVALNRQIFRGMIFTMGAAALAMDRLGVPKPLIWSFAKLQARNTCRLLGVRVTIHGEELVRGGGPYVFTPNHQAHIDIAALLGYLPGDNRFASKQELFEEPVLGAVMRTLGMLPVDREDAMKSIDVLNRAVEQGHSIIIFPEGTRSRDGSLLPFKKGAFVAAIEMARPVVPVILKGTRRVMPKGGYLSVQPGEVEIVVKPPIPTQGLGYDDRDRLRDAVREIIAEEFTRPIAA
ncbi:MAG: 1-acyl-sn-glycerol-3-phosphate acyltransferase [Deltaproteobacteria bacterium]|nr:1-acyl-sn-glycerol-3-phosphate acyltransferase [Deltaproteobacteria bacterium]